MSRPLRIEYKNAFYHVIARGARREAIFHCDKDKDRFLEKLGETVEKYKLLVHAYVLMENHYHLLLETPHGNLSESMHYLNASYGNWFRFTYKIAGSVFQGRYKAILAEKDEYLKVWSAYIHLNPVRAGIVTGPSLYRYSSYPYYSAKIKAPAFLRTRDLLGLFNNRNEYRKYVTAYSKATTPIDPEEIYGKNSLLGSERFLRKVFAKIKTADKAIDKREQPDVRDAVRVKTDDILEIMMVKMRIAEADVWSRKRGNVFRKLLIYGLRRHTASSLKEIGEIMDMDYSAVSGMARRFEQEMKTNKNQRQLAERLAKEVMKRRMLKS
jgi:putative transposase